MKKKIIIDDNLASQADFICEIVREAATKSQVVAPEDIILIQPSGKHFDPAGSVPAFLLIGGAASAWFTKKWLDEYVWPIIKAKIDRPSKKIIENLQKFASDI